MKKGFTLAETLVTLTILGVIMAIVMPLINKAKPDRDVIMYKKGLHTIQSAVGNATDVILNNGALTNAIWADSDYVENDANFGIGTHRPNFCLYVADLLNTTKADCDITAANQSYMNPQIITTDGMRYWGLPTTGGFATMNTTESFCMDRPGLQNGASNKELSVLGAVRTFKATKKDGSGNTTSRTHNSTSSILNADNDVDCDTSITARGLRVVVRGDGKVTVPSDNANYNSYEEQLVERSFNVQQEN